MPDESAHSRILYRPTKTFQLFTLAFHHQLDPAIDQIPHHPNHFVTSRHGFGCETEAYTLDASRITDGQPAAIHRLSQRAYVQPFSVSDWASGSAGRLPAPT
jgi:hypothetical protein